MVVSANWRGEDGRVGGNGGIGIGIIVTSGQVISYKWEMPREAKARPLPEGLAAAAAAAWR